MNINDGAPPARPQAARARSNNNKQRQAAEAKIPVLGDSDVGPAEAVSLNAKSSAQKDKPQASAAPSSEPPSSIGSFMIKGSAAAAKKQPPKRPEHPERLFASAMSTTLRKDKSTTSPSRDLAESTSSASSVPASTESVQPQQNPSAHRELLQSGTPDSATASTSQLVSDKMPSPHRRRPSAHSHALMQQEDDEDEQLASLAKSCPSRSPESRSKLRMDQPQSRQPLPQTALSHSRNGISSPAHWSHDYAEAPVGRFGGGRQDWPSSSMVKQEDMRSPKREVDEYGREIQPFAGSSSLKRESPEVSRSRDRHDHYEPQSFDRRRASHDEDAHKVKRQRSSRSPAYDHQGSPRRKRQHSEYDEDNSIGRSQESRRSLEGGSSWTCEGQPEGAKEVYSSRYQKKFWEAPPSQERLPDQGRARSQSRSGSRSPKRVKIEVKQEENESIPGLTPVTQDVKPQVKTEEQKSIPPREPTPEQPQQIHITLPPSQPKANGRVQPPLPSGPRPPAPPLQQHPPKRQMRSIQPLVPRKQSNLKYRPSTLPHVFPEMDLDEERTQSFVMSIPQDESSQPHVLVGTSDFKATYSKQEQLGEGTFGVVWKGAVIRSFGPASRSKTWQEQAGLAHLSVNSEGQVKRHHVQKGTVVALKQILHHQEFEGMPITSLREIKILKMLDHPNCVALLDMAAEEGDKTNSGKNKRSLTFMVFPYMEHDLAGLLSAYKLQEKDIKLFTMQLLDGTHYLHTNHILHRDMKSANLLIDKKGLLKIADFGLARPLDPEQPRRKYTGTVVTRWYRPPELLLGERNYSYAVDIWGIGCIVAEMFVQRPFMPGHSDLDQAQRIFAIFGRPSDYDYYRNRDLPGLDGVKVDGFSGQKRIVQEFSKFIPKHGDLLVSLMGQLMHLDPTRRASAIAARDHPWFWTSPAPAVIGEDRAWNPSKEMDRKRARDHDVRKEQMRGMPHHGQPHKHPAQSSAAATRPSVPQRPGYPGPGGGQRHPPPAGFVKSGPPAPGGYGTSGARQNRAPPPGMLRK